jgi:hypothetical protein
MEKNRDFYIKNVSHLSVQDIVDGIRRIEGIKEKQDFFESLRATGEFVNIKQKEVKAKLAIFEEEDNAFNAATTLGQLRDFLRRFPQSGYSVKVREKITQKENTEKEAQRSRINHVRRNINDYTPDEVKGEFGDDFLRDLCEDLDIEYNVVDNYDEPQLNFNDIPQTESDVPTGYTDVFFWGIPSSGKTCALATILRTIRDKYTMTSPTTETKFGATYRDSLVNIFNKNTGYLPAATQKDRTQYMPFLLKKREEKNYRQISFFELSGEVFKYFYELDNGSNILEEDDRNHVESAFRTLNLLLNSKNQKIHFFFIDYNQETKGTKDKHNLTQENYLASAASYFRDKNNIFKKRTDAVYVVVTKADEIKGEKKTELAKQFLAENFGAFMDAIKHRCKKDSVDFNVKIFSIGDVFFKRICKINYTYAENFVEDLLKKVKPINDTWFGNILRS